MNDVFEASDLVAVLESGMSETIRVNFNVPVPLPAAGGDPIPQSVAPLHIFEPLQADGRTSLDGSGQIAMACFSDDEWKHG